MTVSRQNNSLLRIFIRFKKGIWFYESFVELFDSFYAHSKYSASCYEQLVLQQFPLIALGKEDGC
jgi:hypothetical protein